MSEAIPGPDARPAPRPGAYAPTVVIRTAVLAANLRAARTADGDAAGHDLPDAASHDAWGHGVATLAAVDTAAVRDPLALYGLPDGAGELRGRPVMSLRGRVLSVKDLRVGEGVSYGYTYRAPRDTRVALVTGGYAQGIVRALGNRVEVAIAGARHPIVGRVAMDVCVVEVADAPVRRGDEVVFFGDPDAGEPPLAAWAAATGLTAAELVTAVGLRAERREVRA